MQELDSRIDSLTQRLATIPEAQKLRELAARRIAVDNAVRDLRIEVADLTTEQRRADADVEQVKARKVRDQRMIDAGQVKDPKALERMLGELQSLERRITDLEDVELDVMERLETAQLQLAKREAELASMTEEETALRAAFERTAATLQTELAEVKSERNTTAAGMPADLVALYERLRQNKGGVGAAALRRRECGGCRLTLNAAELGDIAKAPSEEVLRCEECDRILVRTSESGV